MSSKTPRSVSLLKTIYSMSAWPPSPIERNPIYCFYYRVFFLRTSFLHSSTQSRNRFSTSDLSDWPTAYVIFIFDVAFFSISSFFYKLSMSESLDRSYALKNFNSFSYIFSCEYPLLNKSSTNSLILKSDESYDSISDFTSFLALILLF